MGTVSIANAMAFAPNFQKGKDAANRIFHLLGRKPQIYDPLTANDANWVSTLHIQFKITKYNVRKGNSNVKKYIVLLSRIISEDVFV